MKGKNPGRQSESKRGDDPVWDRISGFLSLKAPKTAETYSGVLREWCEFLGASAGSPESSRRVLAATDLHALSFRAYLAKRPGERPRAERKESSSREVMLRDPIYRRKKDGLEATLSNATIAKKFAVLRRIYRMLIGSGFEVALNPFDSDRVPAPPRNAGRKRPTEMVDFALVKKVLNSVNVSTAKGLRDKAVLCALFGGALRSSEVAGLTVGDVRKTRAGTVFLYLRSTKAKKDAEQALPKWAAEVILKLAALRIKEGARTVDPLFIGFTGKAGKAAGKSRMSSTSVYRLFKAQCEAAGAGKFLTPHSARATAITRLLAEGIPHREVQEFSRHSSIQMVELYDKRRIGVDESAGKDLDFD